MNNDVAAWDMIDFNPEEWVDEFIRILKPSGNLFIFTSYNQLGRWYKCLDHRFDTSNFMIWHKTNPAPKVFKAGFLNSCEMIFTCWNKKHTWNFISQAEMHNFIESPICMRPERLSNPKHPTQKPVSILKKMIEIASNEGDIVFDPFMGVGSTGVAAIELGRRFIGVEIDKEYFNAAKQRIDSMTYDIKDGEVMACEENAVYQTSLFDLETPYDEPVGVCPTGLAPLVKWPGGKEKELKYILPNAPKFERYFEPFVGGGSVFMAIPAKEHYVNDFSSELVQLYRNIANSDKAFFAYAYAIENSWERAGTFFHNHLELVDLYLSFRNDGTNVDGLKKNIKQFCIAHKDGIEDILGAAFSEMPSVLLKEMETNLYRKMCRMKVLEQQKHLLPEVDLCDNIETAIKSAVYMNYRSLYNSKAVDMVLHCALFLFIRNYAYSGMFRYNDKGEFNVPYGGIGYNGKSMRKKLDYYQSIPLLKHFSSAHIYNQDFEQFLREANPTERDFIFLDPPYDSEFSTYAQNEFTRSDQKRLADYLTVDCKAKWLLIIKNTDFIYSLYDKEGINIRTFDKEYLVSFMNRNDKKVTHLLITNY